MKLFILCLTLFVYILHGAALAQEPVRFQLPIDCIPGENCWVMNYVDMGPVNDGAATDPFCNNRTYEDHEGTDFAVLNQSAMEEGATVLAAADGRIIRTRNTEEDRWATDEQLSAAKDARKECGNAVLIEHGNALQTVYCHLKKGSVTVEAGQNVKAGDKIGEVGLSGYTEFPHVHFGIFWEGSVMDPFTGLNHTDACGGYREKLWAADVDLQYRPLSIYHTGFDDKVPELTNIDLGETSPEFLSPDAPAITFWGIYMGAKEGDLITLRITDPKGRIFVQRNIEQPKTRARQFYFVGRDLSQRTLIPGLYVGEFIVKRTMADGEENSWKETASVTVTDN